MIYHNHEKKISRRCAMIYEFTFTNFRSYKNEATIDFVAKPISEFENTLLHGKEVDLLPVCVIYGPNGGGKAVCLWQSNHCRILLYHH